MPSSADRPSLAIHATAVAIGGRALLIRGPSKAGKSTLALALIESASVALPIHLVGDDRILLTRAADAVLAAPHPRIAGLIEKRGDGILVMPHHPFAPVAGLIDLPPVPRENGAGRVEAPPFETTCDLMGKNFPSLFFVKGSKWEGRCAAVLEWFAATSVAHWSPKMPQ